MSIIIKGIYIIVVLFFLSSVESFFSALFGFKVAFFLILLLQNRLDRKLLLVISFLFFLILDVMNHWVLGSNFLMALIPLILHYILSLFLSTNSGFFYYIFKLVALFVYYILIIVVPPFLLNRVFGTLSFNEFISISIKVFISTILLVILEGWLDGFRDRGRGSEIKIK